MRYELNYNNVPFSDFNTFYDGSQLFDTPSKDVSFFSVAGRNGDLTISNDRYNNIDISVKCFIRENFIENYSNLINFLSSQEGYCRFETTEEPDIFRMAEFVNAIKPETGAFLKYGNFELVFNCKPQKYLLTGEIGESISGSTTIENPTLMDSKPLLEVTGTGTITINDSVLELANNTSKTYIDCDIQDAYEGTINRNSDLTVTNGFPTLTSGTNSVSVSGCSVVLYPRWWKI